MTWIDRKFLTIVLGEECQDPHSGKISLRSRNWLLLKIRKARDLERLVPEYHLYQGLVVLCYRGLTVNNTVDIFKI